MNKITASDPAFDLSEIEEKELKDCPVIPLYLSMRSLSCVDMACYWPKLTKEQRTILQDLDLFEKDKFQVEKCHFFAEVCFICDDEQVKFELASSDYFQLFLKSRFNIWTFDDEDPLYPEHDNYFLTVDRLLLFEFDEDYQYIREIKYFIETLYENWGVENAYAFLFKMVNSSQISFEEELYQDRNRRLEEYGIVDYYKSLEILNAFQNETQLVHHVARQMKSKKIVELNDLQKRQVLSKSLLVPFNNQMELFKEELSKVNSSAREDFLAFNFFRLISATITFTNFELSHGKLGKNTAALLLLGLSYLKDRNLEVTIFDYFDFIDLYKIGNSLIKIKQQKINKMLLGVHENFLGEYWTDFLANSFKAPPIFEKEVVDNLPTYEKLSNNIETFKFIVPFIQKIYATFKDLQESQKIQSSYYHNYDIEDIDFESIIISSFVVYALDLQGPKMGITILELKEFMTKHSRINLETKENELKTFPELNVLLTDFKNSFGLDLVPNFEEYLYQILINHLNGYQFENLTIKEFEHVGGPIILKK